MEESSNNLRYADDTTIVAEDSNDLELRVNKVNQTSAKVSLKQNLAKTKIVTTGKSQNLKIRQDLDLIEYYAFLGLLITKDINCTK